MLPGAEGLPLAAVFFLAGCPTHSRRLRMSGNSAITIGVMDNREGEPMGWIQPLPPNQKKVGWGTRRALGSDHI